MPNMLQKLFLITSVVAAILFDLSNPNLYAQSKDILEQKALKELTDFRVSIERFERNQRKQVSQSNRVGNLSLRNFTRGGRHTGNLIQVPFISNLNVSAGYWGSFINPSRITWPRGSGVEYGHTMTFIFGAKVNDDEGGEHFIISESYGRGGGDRDPSGSHQFFFTPLPGYYNMFGDQRTENRLNDNSDDRQRLEDANFYFVGGLNEDSFVLQDDIDNISFPIENRIEYPAMSHLVETWPEFWPVGTYPGDDRIPGENRPGLRSGRWNGQFGAFVRGDQETYYKADDRDNDEFPYYPFIDPETGEVDRRDWKEGGRRGIGIEASARQYQWNNILAEDIFIAQYEITNISRNDIPEIIAGNLVDYDIGGNTGNNRALFDRIDDITYQWSGVPLVRNGFNVGYGAVGFLESPGNPFDGFDNDFNGLIDESQFNDIDDDGDWVIWEDINGNGVFDPGIDLIWDDVGSDGLGPDDEGYPGPDPDGTETNGRPDLGEPNFEFTDNDEIDQLGLTNVIISTPTNFNRDLMDDELFWEEYMQPVPTEDFIVPETTSDIMYVYTSGIVSMAKDEKVTFAIAYLAGNDFQDILRNKRTMQNIYDNDYNFAKAPNTPFLTAVPGDGKVTLVWDNTAERSRDPIYGFDFEMYKIYKSTDPEFNEIKTITDAFGNPLLWKPLAQFDLDNGLQGPHPIQIGDFGISYDMGSDSGLEYSFIDEEVDNGRTYYYAVVSVDQGYADNFFDDGISQIPNLNPISPSESSKIIQVDAFDKVTSLDRNTAAVVPKEPIAGYIPAALEGDRIEKISGKSTAKINVQFLIPDESNSKGYEYEFTFTDDQRYRQLDSLFLDHGITTGFILKNVTTGDTLATNEPGAQGAKIFDTPELNVNIYDGMKFQISNPLRPEVNTIQWLSNPNRARRPAMAVNADADGDNSNRVPRDYEIRILEAGADTSTSLSQTGRIPTNFQLWDVTDPNGPFKLPFSLIEEGNPPFPQDTLKGNFTPGDVIDVKVRGVETPFGLVFSESTWRFAASMSDQNAEFLDEITEEVSQLYDTLAVYEVRGLELRPFGGSLTGSQTVEFLDMINPWYEIVLDSMRNVPDLNEAIVGFKSASEFKNELDELFKREVPQKGDNLLFTTEKPLNSADLFRFKVTGNEFEEQIPESVLDSIYVAPNPYVAVNPLEPRSRNIPGRGDRRVDFRNLPREVTIRIFTISGRLINTLHHTSNSEFDSFISWDLKSNDGLDVAYGVYIYHVNAPGIGEKIGRIALIK
jgi:hypothetical protein